MANRQARRRRRTLFFLLLFLILAAVTVGIVLGARRRAASGAELITLIGNDITAVTATDDHILMVDGTTLNYITADGKIAWASTLPEAGMLPAGSLYLNAAYGPNRVIVFDKEGRAIVDQTTDYPILDASCGSEAYALTCWEEDQRLVRVMKLDAAQIDELRYPYETVLDTGFSGSGLGQLWTLSLDSHFTLPVAHLKTYHPGKSTTANISMSGDVAYRVLPLENEFVTVGTHNLQRWDATGKVLFTKLIYGWTVIDMNTDEKGRVQLLLTPSNTSGDAAALSALWYIRMDSATSTTEYRLSLPTGTQWACLGKGKILALTADALHTTTFAGERYRSYPLDDPLEDVEAVLSGKLAVLRTVHGWRLLPLN